MTLGSPLPFARKRAGWIVLATLAGGLIASRALAPLGFAAGPAGPGGNFADQLAAGEFAPALAAAEGINGVPARDNMLGQLANAQAQAGARDAAFSTLLSMGSDRTRSQAMQATRDTVPTAPGAQGGAQANFTQLIDLITSTVKPTTWDEVGGPGSIQEFRNGVYVNPAGELKRVLESKKAEGLAVARLSALDSDGNTDMRRYSGLRKVSLTRLEKHVQKCLAAGLPLDDDMLNLAGLEKIRYVLVYPETGDLVLAGPACDWRVDEEGRHVSRKSGRPVLQLDDLVVVLRYLSASPHGTFGCSINPTQEGLARTKQFTEQSAATPLKPGQRGQWLKKIQSSMGQQTISVDGIDPRTRVARVLVEADYRMKLVGMGLEQGTPGVRSYLDLVSVPKGKSPPPMDVLRWWFTLKYDAVQATEDHNAFEIRGPGVQVQSENEMLTSRGERIHSGASEPLNQEFAQSFTQHFGELAQKYPVYADLQNIFDLALVGALISNQGLADKLDWHATCFNDADQYEVRLGPTPASVDSVINHRVINQKYVVVGVSGGVHVSPWQFISNKKISVDNYGKLDAARSSSAAKQLPRDAWWWD